MPNAAHALADLLAEWRVSPRGQTVRTTRGLSADNADGWRVQVRAAALLHEVDEFLATARAQGRSVDHYTRGYSVWAKAIFAPDYKWNEGSQGTQAVADQPSIDLLRGLGDLVSAWEIAVPLSPSATKTSTEALDELLTCLKDPGISLTQPERQYVFELILSVRRVFDESDVLGRVDLLHRVHELLGVMNLLAESLAKDPSTKGLAKRIAAAARRVVPYAKFGATVTAGSIGAAADLLQITSGS